MRAKPGETRAHLAHRRTMGRTANAFRHQRELAAKMGVPFTLTLEEVRAMVQKALGCPCRFCYEAVTPKTFSLDHIISLAQGGAFDANNLQVICQPCNERKGRLSAEEFQKLTTLIAFFSEESRRDVLRRLRAGAKAIRGMFIRAKVGAGPAVQSGVETPPIL